MTLLDVGCGWGGALEVALQNYDVNVIGITLSRNQHAWTTARLAKVPTARSVEVRLQGWEEFTDKVDRIVSIGAFEAFTKPRYRAFFDMAHRTLPADGRMLLHTILGRPQGYFAANNVAITMNDLRFMRFIGQEIFPGGELPSEDDVVDFATTSGFGVERIHSLRAHYARTLDMWAGNLEANRRGDRNHRRGQLRPVHALPDRVRGLLPPRHLRHRAVHSGQVERSLLHRWNTDVWVAVARHLAETRQCCGYCFRHPGTHLVTTTVTVISKTRHHLLSSHHIDADKTTGPTKTKPRPIAGNL